MLLHRLLCLVPQDVCNSDKIEQINNYMYSKINGKSFKYQNTETMIK